MRVDLSVYLVADPGVTAPLGRSLPQVVRHAVDGGVTTVQVRGKELSTRALLGLVHEVSAAVSPCTTVLVNDRVDVYLAARAGGAHVHGVHVGQDDLPPEQVRALVGPGAIVGLSAATASQLSAVVAGGAVDYVGIGVLRSTATKPDAPQALGVAGMARRAGLADVPSVAIGGISVADVAALRRGSLAGVAVASGICAAPDPRAAAAAYAAAWEQGAA